MTTGPVPEMVPETVLAAEIDRLRTAPGGAVQLLALLPENLPGHRGRSSAEMVRLRGYLLASFLGTGLPDGALPFVVESLQTGDQPYEVAGAAIGLRAHPGPPAHALTALVRALHNLTGADATVTFEAYQPPWPYRRPTTALTEVVRTIGHFGPRAASALTELELLVTRRDRYSKAVLAEMEAVLATHPRQPAAPDPAPDPDFAQHQAARSLPAPTPLLLGLRPPAAEPVLLEDQAGERVTFDDLFTGRPAVVAFFYTRCENPYKCTLTVTRLGAMQQQLRRRGLQGAVTLAAISYDADFDLPVRLARYGADRGFRFDAESRFLRTISGFRELRDRFRLGVNYGAGTVNRHQVEVYVLAPSGDLHAAFTRVQWDVDEVLEAAVGLLPAGARSS